MKEVAVFHTMQAYKPVLPPHSQDIVMASSFEGEINHKIIFMGGKWQSTTWAKLKSRIM